MEKQVQNYLRNELKKRGSLVIKIVVASIVGTPDLLVIDSVKGIFMIEVKSEIGKLSPAQRLMIDRLRAHGMRVYVVKGMEEAREFLNTENFSVIGFN